MPSVTCLAVLLLSFLRGGDLSDTQSGVTCRVTSATVSTGVVFGTGYNRRHEASLFLSFTGAHDFVIEHSIIGAAMDETEHDIREVSEPTKLLPPGEVRARLQSEFMLALGQGNSRNWQKLSTNLTRCPPALGRLSGVITAVIAKRMVREKVTLEVMPEPVEIVPGVTLMITQFTPGEQYATISYEVRVRRNRPDIAPGFEPIFAGLVSRGGDGRVLARMPLEYPAETRDEFVYSVEDTDISLTLFGKGRAIEACVYDGLERVTFNVAVADLEVTTPSILPPKGAAKP